MNVSAVGGMLTGGADGIGKYQCTIICGWRSVSPSLIPFTIYSYDNAGIVQTDAAEEKGFVHFTKLVISKITTELKLTKLTIYTSKITN